MVSAIHSRRLRQCVERNLILFEPLAVGLTGRQFVLQFFIGNQSSLLQVDQQHLAGLQAALELHIFGPDGEYARL